MQTQKTPSKTRRLRPGRKSPSPFCSVHLTDALARKKKRERKKKKETSIQLVKVIDPDLETH